VGYSGMQFVIDRQHKSTLLEQVREQLLSALHTGKMGAGDRLPSVRQLALRNGINVKTALAIYQRLRDEGYLELRTGSGAYVSAIEGAGLEQAYWLSMLRLIKSNLSEAVHLRVGPEQYAALVQSYVSRSRSSAPSFALIECNHEQINVFGNEISSRLRVPVLPVHLGKLRSPDRSSARLLADTDYFLTTHFHFREVKQLVGHSGKKVLQIALNPAFFPTLVAGARRGRLLMIVSNTDFFPRFKRALLEVGTPREVVERISAVDGSKLSRVRSAVAKAGTVYISPVCDPLVRQVIPTSLKELKFESILSPASLESLEALLLVHAQARPNT
jgi:DNA-binding transcriptional regulator YhcF (GntR family)